MTFLSEVPAYLPDEEIKRAKGAPEKIVFSGREIYLLCPNGYGKSRLSNNFLERKLKLAATTRNWNTAAMLLNLAEEI